MTGKHLTVFALVGALGVTGCADGLGPEGNASQEDRDEILALLDESGFFADEFGTEGASDGGQAAGLMLSAAAGQAEVEAPRVWGRRRGFPVGRLVTVDVDPRNGTALVSKEVFFEGKFLLDISPDDQLNPTEKPLEEKLVQYASFRRFPVEAADAQGRRWRLVEISPAAWVMTEESRRTVELTRVAVWVNGELSLDLSDPSEMLKVDGRVPTLHPEDEVTVRAWVENELDNGNAPDTFVLLHLFHATQISRAWIRWPMERVATDVDTYYELAWHARRTGRARIAVDAIDAETFTTESEDDYRANIWGVPYRIVPVDEGP
jgi:hypothetical protein